MILKTARLILRCWRDTDRGAFAALNADPEVTWDLGGPLDRRQSDEKLDRYIAAFDRHGFGRWALEDSRGAFLGYAGVMPSERDHPLGPHAEIGWRLARSAWGHGYASEAARAALQDGFARKGFAEVLSYTSSDNARSQAVMGRLGLRRDPSRDFSKPYRDVMWHGLVWTARQPVAASVSLQGSSGPTMFGHMSDNIRFALNDMPVELSGVSPMTTLLDWLRDHRGLKGTKEGCAEGDCGACTVVLERADGKREVLNSCIALLGQMDGQSVRTVEGLLGKDGAPHPVQLAMAEADATQCGFCTPGFVMTAYAFAAGGEKPELETIHDALAGNLCRCTGYRPIVEAMTKIAGLAVEPAPTPPTRSASVAFNGVFFAPRTLGELLKLRADHPDALLLAGATDLGLLASRSRKPPKAVIHVAHVPELAAIVEGKQEITIGAAVTYAQAMPTLIAAFPAMRTYLARLGSRQIRTLGTIGGNIGTASPIGDMPPVLLALETRLKLVSVRGARDVPLEKFFLDYRKTALAPDEVIESLTLPRLWPGEVFFCDKVSKRRDQDIATVAGAYRLRIKHGKIEHSRLAFGGMAAIPMRAAEAEAALLKSGFAAAAAALAKDFQPIDDWRGSGLYRLQVAANLLRRLELRLAEPTRVVEVEAL
jgi:xanthine dehydrogenase small subunit